MRRVENVIEEYDQSDITDRKKILLIEWFQKHPGKRFDLTEVHRELGDELDIGRTRTGQILKELVEESVLDSHGNQRKAYALSEDILIPVKYQAIAGLRHLWTVVDVKRWGVIGILVISTILWLFLTLPLWFFSGVLLVSPSNQLGPISESELIVFTLLMTVWLLLFTICTSSLQMIRRWWNERIASE